MHYVFFLQKVKSKAAVYKAFEEFERVVNFLRETVRKDIKTAYRLVYDVYVCSSDVITQMHVCNELTTFLQICISYHSPSTLFSLI